MLTFDRYAEVGFAVELLAQSPYHRQFSISDYLRVEILPPLSCGQARFYLTDEGTPAALVTWAWLSPEVEQEVHATGRALRTEEWTCGERHFFNDWITPYGNIAEVMHDISHTVFPDTIATSLRRNMDGSVRRINRWTGVNVRRKPSEMAA